MCMVDDINPQKYSEALRNELERDMLLRIEHLQNEYIAGLHSDDFFLSNSRSHEIKHEINQIRRELNLLKQANNSKQGE